MRERTDSTALSINNVLPTKIDPSSLRFESNMRALADLVAQVRNEEEKIREGGGAKAIESQHSKSRLTARERIDLLADPGSFFELGLYAAHKMYEDWGGAPAAGVVTSRSAVVGTLASARAPRRKGARFSAQPPSSSTSLESWFSAALPAI